jgi:hypothetical protein
MDARDRRWFAKQFIAEVVRSLKDNKDIVFVEEKRAYILIVTSGKSVLRFNPQEQAEIIVEKSEETVKRIPELKDNPEDQRRAMCQESIRTITHLIHGVSKHFDDALWILQYLSGALSIETDLGAFHQEFQAGVKVSMLSHIDNRLREILRLPRKSSKLGLTELKEVGALSRRLYAVTDEAMLEALQRLKRFSITGVARELGRDPKEGRVYVYDWMKRHDNMTREMLEKEWRKIHKGV